MPVLVSAKPIRRYSLKCRLLRRHTPASFSMRATGERWYTHIAFCRRCGTVMDLHAEKQ